MKKLLRILGLLILASGAAFAQDSSNPISAGSGAPGNPCTQRRIYIDNTGNVGYGCGSGNAWFSLGGGGGGGTPGSPSGSLQYNNGGAFAGVVGSAVDSDGSVLLQSPAFTVLTSHGSGINLNDDTGAGIILFAQGGGVISINTTTSAFALAGDGGAYIEDGTADGITLDATGPDYGSTGTGPIKLIALAGVQLPVVAFSGLPSAPVEGTMVGISDSNVTLFGTTITGSGAFHGLAYYDGTNWTFR